MKDRKDGNKEYNLFTFTNIHDGINPSASTQVTSP
uniref:Uncharacterized protein n=1 Tax=Rhizophora mucronata TaxID=61149 RepID=A0A2P2LGW9_RHIMU